jgi:hypothetical protein
VLLCAAILTLLRHCHVTANSLLQQALQRISEDIKGVPIDAVLYVDRLDLYRVEPLDKRVSVIWL